MSEQKKPHLPILGTGSRGPTRSSLQESIMRRNKVTFLA